MRKSHENLQKLSYMRKKYVNLESKGSRYVGFLRQKILIHEKKVHDI